MIAKTPMTASEFEAVYGQYGPCELVRGQVVPLSLGGFQHSRIAIQIGHLLQDWASRTQRGRVIGCEAGMFVEEDPDTVRGADAAYISYQRLPKGTDYDGFCRTPPELVVEVIGRGQGWTAMLEKVGEYLNRGVDRVWVVDGDTRRVHVFAPHTEPQVYGCGQELRDDETLPGFKCQVDAIFED